MPLLSAADRKQALGALQPHSAPCLNGEREFRILRGNPRSPEMVKQTQLNPTLDIVGVLCTSSERTLL